MSAGLNAGRCREPVGGWKEVLAAMWETIKFAIQGNARTARLVLILVVLVIGAWLMR